MSTVVDVLKGAVDAAFRQNLEQSQHYQNTKAELEADAEYVGTVGKVAAYIGIGSVALAFLGIGFFAARREGTGGAMICGAVPLAIFSYDCYQASENFRTQVEEDPVKLMTLATVNDPIPVNVVALRKCLLNKTLFFEPFMDFYIRRSIRSVELD
jgi:hypothetical protein